MFSLHTKEGEVTSFTMLGFPHSPYPNNALCYWALRANASSSISLTFKTLELEPCRDDSDYIKVYDSLSPVDPHTLVRWVFLYNIESRVILRCPAPIPAQS